MHSLPRETPSLWAIPESSGHPRRSPGCVSARCAPAPHWRPRYSRAPLEVPVEFDLREERGLERLDNDREDLKHRADRLVLPGEDVEEGVALGLVGSLVEDRLHYALAMMDGPREIESAGDHQVVEPHVLAIAPVDLECDEAGARAVGRVGHRFARTALITAAILDVLAFDLPALARHFRLPCLVCQSLFGGICRISEF